MPYINDVYIPEDRYMDLSGVEDDFRPLFMAYFRYVVYTILLCAGVFVSHMMLSTPKASDAVPEKYIATPRKTYTSSPCSPCRYWMPINSETIYADPALDERLERQIPALYWNSRRLGEMPCSTMPLFEGGPGIQQGSYRYALALSNGCQVMNIKATVSIVGMEMSIPNVMSNKTFAFACSLDEQRVNLSMVRTGFTNNAGVNTWTLSDRLSARDPRKVYAAKRIADVIQGKILQQQSNALCLSANRDQYAMWDRIDGAYNYLNSTSSLYVRATQ